MSTFTVKAFTDYYGEVEPITILSYDGDKYARILRANGEEDEIKSGYCYKNAVKYKDNPERFSRVVWWKLEGKSSKDYKPRAPILKSFKGYWRVDWSRVQHHSLQEAVKSAYNILKERGTTEVEITHNNRITSVFVEYDGRVVEYNWRQSNMRDRNKNLPHCKFKKNLSRMLGYKY